MNHCVSHTGRYPAPAQPPVRSIRAPRAVSAALAVAALASLLGGCGGKTEAAPAERPVLTVEVVAPARDNWPDIIVASGEVAPWQEASIGAEVAGVRLDEVLVNVGDVVKKDQLLARYNEDMLRADLERLDAAVAEAEANIEKAKADAERGDRLETSGGLSKQSVQLYRTQARVAEAQLASARATRNAQKLKLRYARVVAPDDGVISSRTATVGAVSVTGAELFRLVRGGRLEWRAQVQADTLSRLKTGQQVEIQVGGGRADASTIAASVRQLSPTVDAQTRNGMVYVDLPKDSALAAGMYVTGRFVLGMREALFVPESAIVQRDGYQYLMSVDAENRAHPVKVSTGRRRGDAIEISSELPNTDRIVKSGGAFLADGDLIAISVAQTP